MDEALDLAAKLKHEGGKLNDYLRALTEEQRSARVYTEGTLWTARDVLAHLMSAERAFLQLFREVQQGGDGVGEDFSVDRFNASEQNRNEKMTWDGLLDAFLKTRAEMIAFVSTLAPEDLEKKGRHPFLGVTNLREMVKLIYIHGQTHLRDVRRAIGAT